MEYLFLPFLKSKILMSRHLFGYRESTSTVLAANIFKRDNIYSYIRNKFTVYSWFLDMSKALERVNHSFLFKKLESFNVNLCFIKLLENVFRNSTASVFL